MILYALILNNYENSDFEIVEIEAEETERVYKVNEKPNKRIGTIIYKEQLGKMCTNDILYNISREEVIKSSLEYFNKGKNKTIINLLKEEINNNEVAMTKEETKEVKTVYFSKGGSGSYSGRVTVPIRYLNALGITKEDNTITIDLENNSIVIKKYEE